MFDNTDGLPGPVIMKRLGNPDVISPRYVIGPWAHFSLQRHAVASGDVDADDRSGHRVEAGGEHDRVELERLCRRCRCPSR